MIAMRGRTLTLEVTEKRGKAAKTIPLYQYDYGQKLLIEGVELPEYYEVHFSNQQYGDAVTVLGDSTGVLIPDSLVATGESIYVWLYLHDTSYDGETEYMGVIPVIKRAEPSDITPTPEEQSIITEVIAALNNMEDDMSDQVNEAKAAKEAAEDAQAGAEAAETTVAGYASAVETAKEAAETAQTAAETAQAAAEAASNAATTAYNNADSARSSAVSAKEYAETAATNASTSATSASGYATNAQNSASSALDAQAAAETAQGKAEDAQTAAETAQAAAEAAEDGVEADALIAEGYAVGKQNGEDVVSGSTYYHNNAKYYADAASDSATAAAGSEDNAEDSAEDAEAYAVGTRGGVDVESDDPAYENNAKYYAEEAATVLADKLDAPATAGTAGQVLTSDGEGGQAWADPSGAIDDTAGEGDTDVTWSADKLDSEFGSVLNAIHQITPDAQQGDIGKALILKTIDQTGKPTAFEYGEAGGGLSNEAIQALLACFAHVAWIDDAGPIYYDALQDALDTGTKTLVSISAVYTQGIVYPEDNLDTLKSSLVVTGTYDDTSTETITEYTLSGTLAIGTSTITVTVDNITTTFTVAVYGFKPMRCETMRGSAGSNAYTSENTSRVLNLCDVGTHKLKDDHGTLVDMYPVPIRSGVSVLKVSVGSDLDTTIQIVQWDATMNDWKRIYGTDWGWKPSQYSLSSYNDGTYACAIIGAKDSGTPGLPDNTYNFTNHVFSAYDIHFE